MARYGGTSAKSTARQWYYCGRELLGLILSIQRLIDNGTFDGTAISDCQGPIGEVYKTRAADFHPFRNTATLFVAQVPQ